MTPPYFPLTVDLSATSLRVEPGGQASVVVSIRNVGQVVQHYEAGIVGLPREMWVRDVEVIKLRPGESGMITVTVRIPVAGPLRGGTYNLAVLVRSPYQPEVSRSDDLTLEVAAVTGVELAVQPAVVEGRRGGRAMAAVSNQGNIELLVTMSATDDQGRARFRVDPPAFAVPPGGQARTAISWEVPAFFTGQARRSAIAVRANTGDQVRAEGMISFVQPPRVPAAVLTVLGIVLAVAVVAGAILVAAVINRPAATPTTSAPTQTTVASPSASASGAKPPTAPALTLSPARPLPDLPVKVTAATSEKINTWSWQVLDAGNNLVATGDTAGSFTWTPKQAGTFTLKLAITSDGGQTTATMPVVVMPVPLQLVTKEVKLAPGLTTVTEACPQGLTPVSGGVTTDAAAGALHFSHSAPTADGWTATVHNPGAEVTGTLTVTCLTPIAGRTVQRAEQQVTGSSVVQLQATCPSGQVVLGGGGGMRPANGTSGVVRQSWPDRDDAKSPWKYWRVSFEATTDGMAEVFAICAPAPKGHTVTIADAAKQGTMVVDLTLTCTKGVLLSAGVALDPHGTVPAGSVAVVNSAGPVLPAPAPPGSLSWAARVSLQLPQSYRLNGYVVCADLYG